MITNSEIIYEAAFEFQQITKVPTEIEKTAEDSFPILRIGEIYFTVIMKSDIRVSNKGFVLSDIELLAYSRPVIVIAKYIAQHVAREFRDKDINYIDVAGNAYINEDNFFVYIIGQKNQKPNRKNTSRAFHEAGIKFIFHILTEPEKLKSTYRKMARVTGISIGSVNNIIRELIELHFILKTKDELVLKNTKELVYRWTLAYNDLLRPRILKKRMCFSDKKDYKTWQDIPIEDLEGINIWGGEPAAAILTKQLQPKTFTIYTTNNWQNVARRLRLIPDENGDVEILSIFWDEKDLYRENNIVTPPLLVYADLMGSGYDRNIQIANEISQSELQHIQ